MPDVIDFLAQMGADADLKHASQDQLASALENARMDAPLQAAIFQRDPSELYALLKQGPLYAMQLPDEDEDEDEDEEPEEEEENDGPGKLSLTRSAGTGCNAHPLAT